MILTGALKYLILEGHVINLKYVKVFQESLENKFFKNEPDKNFHSEPHIAYCFDHLNKKSTSE